MVGVKSFLLFFSFALYRRICTSHLELALNVYNFALVQVVDAIYLWSQH